MFDKMKNVKEKVKELLTTRPELRDDDNRLVANIYLIEAGGLEALQRQSAQQFLSDLIKGKYSNFESIRRVRQKLQEENPQLRGTKYNKRKKTGEDISDEIKNL